MTSPIVLFTPDVYSFVPGRANRVALLRKLASWTGPRGAIHLSARVVDGAHARLVLTVRWLAGRGAGEWGDSHTRWPTPAGVLRRSFLHVFTKTALGREVEEAGLAAANPIHGSGLVRLAPWR